MAIVSRDQLKEMTQRMIPRVQEKPPTQSEDEKVAEIKLQQAAREMLKRVRGLSNSEASALEEGVHQFSNLPDEGAGERKAELEGLAAYKRGDKVADEWYETPLGKLKARGG